MIDQRIGKGRVTAVLYLGQGQMSVVILHGLLQLLQIEWNDLVVERDQFLLLDVVLRLVGYDCNFYALNRGKY